MKTHGQRARGKKKPKKAKAHRPGSSWRVLAQGPRNARLELTVGPRNGVIRTRDGADSDDAADFDELVVDSWFHLERMDTHTWWMRIDGRDPEGDLVVWVTVDREGRAKKISVEREKR